MAEPDPPRTDETIAQLFPGRGERPPDTVTVDPDAPPSPNTAHPAGDPDV